MTAAARDPLRWPHLFPLGSRPWAMIVKLMPEYRDAWAALAPTDADRKAVRDELARLREGEEPSDPAIRASLLGLNAAFFLGARGPVDPDREADTGLEPEGATDGVPWWQQRNPEAVGHLLHAPDTRRYADVQLDLDSTQDNLIKFLRHLKDARRAAIRRAAPGSSKEALRSVSSSLGWENSLRFVIGVRLRGEDCARQLTAEIWDDGYEGEAGRKRRARAASDVELRLRLERERLHELRRAIRDDVELPTSDAPMTTASLPAGGMIPRDPEIAEALHVSEVFPHRPFSL